MIIVAASLIFVGLICHALLSTEGLKAMARQDEAAKWRLQKQHQNHEMEFARMQVQIFQDNQKHASKTSQPNNLS